MWRTAIHLWHDERGFIISAELVLIGTIAVLGLVAGLTCLRDSVVAELKDVGWAIGSLNQSYRYSGMHGCWRWCGISAWTAGSAFVDVHDGERGDRCDLGVGYWSHVPRSYGVRTVTPPLPCPQPCPQVDGKPCQPCETAPPVPTPLPAEEKTKPESPGDRSPILPPPTPRPGEAGSDREEAVPPPPAPPAEEGAAATSGTIL